jgi:hypothetical protein
MGDFIYPTKLYWADGFASDPDRFGDHVVSQRKSAHVSSFKLYFLYDGTGPNNFVIVFFDLNASCVDERLKLEAVNVSTEPPAFMYSIGFVEAYTHPGPDLPKTINPKHDFISATEKYAQELAQDLSAQPNATCTKGTFDSRRSLDIY